MTIVLIVVGLGVALGITRAVSQMNQTGSTHPRKCAYCSRRLKQLPGKMKIADVCGHCGRTQPFATKS